MPLRRLFSVALLALFALPLTGCIQARQDLLVMPDGSGKMSFRIAVNLKMVKDMVKGIAKELAEGEEPAEESPVSGTAADVSVEDLIRNYDGFVAFTRPVSGESGDGWAYTEFTGYFEDVNLVKIYDDDTYGTEREPNTSFRFEPKDGGYVLTVIGKVAGGDDLSGLGGGEEEEGDLTPEEKKEKEAEERMAFAMMKSMFKGFAVDVCWTLPGDVEVGEGLTASGHTARFGISDKDFTDMAALKRLGEVREFVIRSGPSKVSAAEMAAFKAELTAARAEWEKIRAEAEAEAAPEDGEDSEK